MTWNVNSWGHPGSKVVEFREVGDSFDLRVDRQRVQAVGAKLGSKRLLWERMRALFYDDALASMRQLFEALLYGFKKSSPLVTMDSS
jgi:hypothetical protein